MLLHFCVCTAVVVSYILSTKLCCLDVVSSSELDQCHWKSATLFYIAWAWPLWQPDKASCKSWCARQSWVSTLTQLVLSLSYWNELKKRR